MHLPAFVRLATFLAVAAFTQGADAPVTSTTQSATLAAPLTAGAKFVAHDSLNPGAEAIADATACLDGLKWSGVEFSVQIEPGEAGEHDWRVRFPTPFPSGDAVNDNVCMEWLVARDAAGQPIKAPAVVVVHESGRGMVVGRTIARGLHNLGLHTFLIHLPGYGARTSEFTRDIKKMLPALKQAVGDVRRAHDAVAALPFVDATSIGLQGTSLGGFVVAAVTGLDRGYDKTFIVLAGGQIAEVLLTGKRDAASMRERFKEAGMTETQIRELSQVIEPMRLAHRIDPARLWMFSGKYDDVVPPACTNVFAKAVKLTPEHHFILPVGHYSGAVLLPAIVPQIAKLMLQPVVAGK